MNAQELLKTLENEFKYPIYSESVLPFLEERLELADDDEDEKDEILEDFRLENIHWASLVEPEDKDLTQSPNVLARQLMGVFAFSSGYFFGYGSKNAQWSDWLLIADSEANVLNVALQRLNENPIWSVLTDPLDLYEVEKDFSDIQRAFDEDKSVHRDLTATFVQKFTKINLSFTDWFSKFDIPNRSASIGEKDAKWQNVFLSFSALARVIVDRETKDRSALLDKSEQLQIVSTLDSNEVSIRRGLINLLSNYLSGKNDAQKIARALLDSGTASKAESFWAQRVIDENF